MSQSLDIVIFGLSVTSSWGNGHATTYRALMRGLDARGHRVTFFERNLPWYAHNRDLPRLPYGRVQTYSNPAAMMRKYKNQVAQADVVIVGSYVPDGIDISDWVLRTARGVTAFYDIDTPVTLVSLAAGTCDYISERLISRYDLYLSFTGGNTLRKIEQKYGARHPKVLYCSADPQVHAPCRSTQKWDLGYIGTYSEDRQPWLDRYLLAPARDWAEGRMVVAGAQYPEDIEWPRNVERVEHLPPGKHRSFYSAQKFTLNLTRDAMRRAGYSPSVRLFEAAACATPIISDYWPGIETLFEPGKDILITRSSKETLEYVRDLPEKERLKIGQSARQRILDQHTAVHRAVQLEQYVAQVRGWNLKVEELRALRTVPAEARTKTLAQQPGD